MDKIVEAITERIVQGGTLFIAGNGGLAAESEHFAAEMVGQYAFPIYVPCKSLTENSSVLTAISNDIGFEAVFAHQIHVWGTVGDVFIGMTTSKSPDVVQALAVAMEKHLLTVVLCSERYDFTADYVCKFGGVKVEKVQENILAYLHKLAYEVKELLRQEGRGECRQ